MNLIPTDKTTLFHEEHKLLCDKHRHAHYNTLGNTEPKEIKDVWNVIRKSFRYVVFFLFHCTAKSLIQARRDKYQTMNLGIVKNKKEH